MHEAVLTVVYTINARHLNEVSWLINVYRQLTLILWGVRFAESGAAARAKSAALLFRGNSCRFGVGIRSVLFHQLVVYTED
jgi:hypothetical protein